MSKDTITVDGVEYVRATRGSRAVVVVDRGWIFAGDVEQKDGVITLHRAVWVFKWQSIGFDGVLKNPKSDKVTIRKMSHVVEIPKVSEIFRIPVDEDWGL